MAMMEEYLEPAMAHIVYKQMPSTEFTMSLEEDERMDPSKPTDFVSTCMDENVDDGISCVSMQSDFDEIHSICSAMVKRVKFAPMASHYPTMSLDEYTQDEIEKAFWTPKQRKGLNKEHMKTVQRMECGLEEKTSSPYRGLEKLTAEGYSHSEDAVKACVNTVMDEMERQWEESQNLFWDWEKIASTTEELTTRSKQEALMTAFHDENEARAAYETINVKKEKVTRRPQRQQKLGKSVSDMFAFSGYLQQLKSGLPHVAVRRTSKKVRKPRCQLESFMRIAEERDR